MPVKVNIDLDLLKEMYIGQNKLLSECADYFGVSVPTVRRNLRSMGIKKPTELRGQIQGKDKIKIDIDELKRYYIDENHTRKETAEHFGVGEHIIKARCRENGFEKTIEAIEANSQKILNNIYGCRSTSVINKPKWVRDVINNEISFRNFLKKNNLKTTTGIVNALGYKNYGSIYRFLTLYNCWELIDRFSSSPERYIYEYLYSRGFIVNKTRKIIPPEEIDVFIEKFNAGIEFNGSYWHSTKKKNKDYHMNKYNKAKAKGIFLYYIYEYELENIDLLLDRFIAILNHQFVPEDNEYTIENGKVPEYVFIENGYELIEEIEPQPINIDELTIYNAGYKIWRKIGKQPNN